ncbi:MAG: hypothetical protein QOF32_939 [Gammaproteobacteria bacterium]|nr:hypothetical protein [Gammaproteobacteria bacterium]
MKIQFGILCHGTTFEHWQLRCLERLLAVADVRAVLLIHLGPPVTRSVPLPDILSSLPAVALADMPARGGREHLADLAVERIRSHDLDFIFSCVTEPCPPELLEAARHGVWAYQFGDSPQYRGGPAGFWEVYEAAPVSAASLVRLRRDIDSPVVLREGYLRTNLLSPAGNRRQLLERFTHWPAQVCVDLRNGVMDRLSAKPLVTQARERGAPTRAQLFRCHCRMPARAARVMLRSLFRHDQWNVGHVERPIASFLHAGRSASIQWLKAPGRSEFIADPFGVWRDGRLTILYEHFSYRSNRGTIAAIEPGRSAAGTPVSIGPEPAVHLSYPYLIEVDGRLLCIPETHEAAEIALYEVERFPDRWVKVATLLEGTPIVDATLFHHQGNWWLAGSPPELKGSTCELHLWHASAITGPWHAHAGNPVKIDIRSARPGGTPFYDNGALYRPAQDCSETYGGRIIINRVHTLTPTAFHETPAATVEPEPDGPYRHGLHTLSRVGDSTLIDGKRMVFAPPEFRRVLMHFLRSAGKRVLRISD